MRVDEVEICFGLAVGTAEAAMPLKPLTVDDKRSNGDVALKLSLKVSWEI